MNHSIIINRSPHLLVWVLLACTLQACGNEAVIIVDAGADAQGQNIDATVADHGQRDVQVHDANRPDTSLPDQYFNDVVELDTGMNDSASVDATVADSSADDSGHHDAVVDDDVNTATDATNADLATGTDRSSGTDTTSGSDAHTSPDATVDPYAERPLGQCKVNADCPVGAMGARECSRSIPGGTCLYCGAEGETEHCPETLECSDYGCFFYCGYDSDCPPGMGCGSTGVCIAAMCVDSACPIPMFGCNSSNRCERISCSQGCPSGTTCLDGLCIEDRMF